MAKAGRRRKRRSNTNRRGAGRSRGVVVGILVIVCAGALAWYYRSTLELTPVGTPPPASSAAPARAEPEAAVARETERFEFYDMLPDAEVEVPVQPGTSGGAVPAPVSVAGTYVVQAGAFPDYREADKVKARLALLGIVAEIQAADANGARFHRVRIGPVDNLDQLNLLRNRLRQNGIEYLVIPIGE
ncbi:MAG: SPOR domain-containing protein [Gammaproteobacteria bacterium]|nr:SPOR domain-containing protein [Gammaproteobacteria bacterium]